MSRDTGYGESKRALAANTSCACCFGAFRASALAITWSRPHVPRGQESSRSFTESRSMDRIGPLAKEIAIPRAGNASDNPSIANRGRLDERRS